MADYRRLYVAGGTYFFTVVTLRRRPIFRHATARKLLGNAMRAVCAAAPFVTVACVLLPDHLHCIWTLPTGDDDYSRRWKDTIRDENDLENHFDYVHYNPVKHGHVKRSADWPWSTFHRYVAEGHYPPDWGSTEPPHQKGLDFE